MDGATAPMTAATGGYAPSFAVAACVTGFGALLGIRPVAAGNKTGVVTRALGGERRGGDLDARLVTRRER